MNYMMKDCCLKFDLNYKFGVVVEYCRVIQQFHLRVDVKKNYRLNRSYYAVSLCGLELAIRWKRLKWRTLVAKTPEAYYRDAS